MKSKIGIITIGQSPRIDITFDLEEIWGNVVNVFEKGCLDGLTLKKIQEMKPKEGDYTLVTRLKNGVQVIIAKKDILPKIQEKIKELNEERVDVILFLCTGELPVMKSKALIIRPNELLHKTIFAIAGGKKVGILVPLPEQKEQFKKEWLLSGVDTVIACGSPYKDKEIYLKGIEELSNKEISLIVMDCIGYSKEMKQKAKKLTDIPIVLPRTLIARVINEIIS